MDLDEIREISYNRGLKFSQIHGFDKYFECSAKTNKNIQDIFNFIKDELSWKRIE
jgi:hypothetical protein